MKKHFKSMVLAGALLTGAMFSAKETPNNLLLEKTEQKSIASQDKILLSEEIVNDASCSYRYSYYMLVVEFRDGSVYREYGFEIEVVCE